MRDESQVSLTGIEIRVDGRGGDDSSTGPLASTSKEKKRNSRKHKSQDKDDDETASRGSMGPLRTKRSSKKKAAAEGVATSDSVTSPDKDDDETASRGSMGPLRNKRSSRKKAAAEGAATSDSVTSPIRAKKSSKKKKSDDEVKALDRTISLKQKDVHKQTANSDLQWENEEYLLSPKAGRQTFDDYSDSDLGHKKRSTRSMMSERSFATDASFVTEGDSMGGSTKDMVAKLTKQVEFQGIENADLKKSLAKALEKITYLSDRLRAQQEDSLKATNRRQDVLTDLHTVSNQSEIHTGLDTASHRQRTSELVAWERTLEEQERQLELERELLEAHEKRLDDRARALDLAETNTAASGSGLSSDDKDALILDLKAECADLIAEKEELAESALEDIREKQREIETLQSKLGVITEEFEERNARELLRKDATIRQLEEELIATRAVIEAKTSDQYSSDMKAQIKALSDQVRTLTKRLRDQQISSRSALSEKESALSNSQCEIAKLQREVARLEETRKHRAAVVFKEASDDSKHFIEELEDEIRHWKRVNLDLEDELEHFKNEATKLTIKLSEDEDQELDDDASVGSFTSHLSKQSMMSHSMRQVRSPKPGVSNKLHHSLSAKSKADMFFAPNGTGGVAESSSDVAALELETSSQRAVRSVTSLWSKMTQKPQHTPVGLYQMSLDD
jgi:hypothetical protein